MKRFVSAILAILMILRLCACGSSGGDSVSTEETLTWQEQYDLGIKYLSEGNYEEAILAFTAAIEIDPKQVDAYIELADAYVGTGDTDAAKRALEQGYTATGDESLQKALEEMELPLKSDVRVVSSEDENIQLEANGTEFKLSMIVPDLRDTYPVNKAEVYDDEMEYAWMVRVTDGNSNYEVGTCYFKIPGSEPSYLTPYDMQSDVWIEASDKNGYDTICDASLHIQGTTMIWTFDLPTEYSFDVENMKILGRVSPESY